jgi:16S rRNA G966 N2-methylase RsmD
MNKLTEPVGKSLDLVSENLEAIKAIFPEAFTEDDNLEVLKLLQKSYANKVKMIYIDPPYNTGKEFIYQRPLSMAHKTTHQGQNRTSVQRGIEKPFERSAT